MTELRRAFRARCIAIAVLAAFGAGCAESSNPGTSPGDSTSFARKGTSSSLDGAASVTVSLAPARITVSQTSQASAVAKDRTNKVLTGKTFAWTSGDTTVATISSSGLATPRKQGSTVIRGTVDGVVGMSVLVVDPDTTNTSAGSSTAPVAAVSVSIASPGISMNQTTQATASLYDALGNKLTGRTIAWSTSNPSVAHVSGSGLISPLGIGTATITATSEGKTGSATITVNAVPVATVGVSLASASIPVGQTTQATAATKDSSGSVLTGRACAWSSSNMSVATVNSSTGLVSAITAGSANIVATCEGKWSQAALTVTAPTPVPVATVSVSLNAPGLTVGQTTQANATTKDANGATLTGRAIAWSSSNTAVATVSTSGLVTSVAAGTANIVATSEGKTGQATVTVTAAAPVPVASVVVTFADSSISVGQTVQAWATPKDSTGATLSGRAITWASSNTAVITVSSSGVVTAVGVGTANVAATSEGKMGHAPMTVVAGAPVPVATVSVSLSAPSLTVGQVTQAAATTKDANGATLTGRTIAWSSSNTAVATVSTSGLVTSVAAGTADIVATSEGKTGQATVTVTAAAPVPVATVSVSLNAPSLTTGQSTQAAATTKDANGATLTGRTIAWSSSNTAVATVSSSGLVTSLIPGTANIIATSEGKTGQATVTVTAPAPIPVATVSVSLSLSSINTGQTSQAGAVTRDANNNVLSGRVIAWTTTNPAVATVTSSGLVTGVGAGTAQITATSEGKIGVATITVMAPPAGGGGAPGTGPLSGTVTDIAGGAVGGGVVEVMSGSTVVQTVPIASNGTFSVASIGAGSYNLRLQPSLAYSMGPSEPATRAASVITGQNTTVNFSVQKALAAEDFQRFSSLSQITAFCTGTPTSSNFWGNTGGDAGGCSHQNDQMFLTPMTAPNGSVTNTLEYQWPARTCPNGPTNCNYYVMMSPRLPAGAVANQSEVWVRVTDKFSSNFRIGGAGAQGSQAEYKFMFIDFTQYGGVDQVTIELDSQQGGAPNNMVQMRLKLLPYGGPNTVTDGLGGNGGYDAPLPSNFFGSWNTWVIGLTGIGSANTTIWVYRNGSLLKSMTGPFIANKPIQSNAIMDVQMGANINNGPDQVQSRYWREFAIYRTRPSLLPPQ